MTQAVRTPGLGVRGVRGFRGGVTTPGKRDGC